MKLAISILTLFLSVDITINQSTASEVLWANAQISSEIASNTPHLLITTTGEGVDISLDLDNLELFSQRSVTARLTRTELKKSLESGTTLFEFNPAAQCRLVHAQAFSNYLEPPKKIVSSPFSALDVTWAFSCAHPLDLKQVYIHLFAHFPQALDSLAIEWVTSSTEGSLEAKADLVIHLQ